MTRQDQAEREKRNRQPGAKGVENAEVSHTAFFCLLNFILMLWVNIAQHFSKSVFHKLGDGASSLAWRNSLFRLRGHRQ